MFIEVRKPTKEELKEAESWAIWEKEVSEFPWEYAEKETCLILQGRAIVSTDKDEVQFSVGDWVVFPAGLKCTWKILAPLKKRYEFG